MSLKYTIKESISGFQRAKLSSAISVLTISISLMLLSIFFVITFQTTKLIDSLRSKVELEAFLQEPISRKQRGELEQRILALEGVDRVDFISKEQAAEIFKQEFGEDISSVLDFNPLPASFKVFLKADFHTSDRAKVISDQLAAMNGIESIKYWKELLDVLDTRTKTVNNLTLGLGLIIGLSAIFLVSNTIRLAIHAKRRIIRTMELVGATSLFIRIPFLLEGVLQGIIGGCLAAVVFSLLIIYSSRLLSIEFSDFFKVDPQFYVTMVISGMVLGFVGSIIAVFRFIRFSSSS